MMGGIMGGDAQIFFGMIGGAGGARHPKIKHPLASKATRDSMSTITNYCFIFLFILILVYKTFHL
jgi:hypothetical protein